MRIATDMVFLHSSRNLTRTPPLLRSEVAISPLAEPTQASAVPSLLWASRDCPVWGCWPLLLPSATEAPNVFLCAQGSASSVEIWRASYRAGSEPLLEAAFPPLQ